MDLLLDVIKDTIIVLPVLFIIYLLLEYLESKEIDYLKYLKKFGPLFASFFGVVPECGFSVISSVLFMEGHITLGTLLSVFIATSDEAVPLLVLNPKMYDSVLLLVGLKVLIALIVGYMVDKIYLFKMPLIHLHDTHHDDNHHSFIVEAIKRTLTVYCFIFVMNCTISFLILSIGINQIQNMLMVHPLLQPIMCILIGFIPNCSISILLVELYSNQMIYFGSLFGALCVNGGLGLFVLFEKKLNYKVFLMILSILFIIGFASSVILNIFI